jgi:hypothetical protein
MFFPEECFVNRDLSYHDHSQLRCRAPGRMDIRLIFTLSRASPVSRVRVDTFEEEANIARGPELDDQIVIKRKTGELGAVPKGCLDCVEFIKLTLSKLS